MAYPVARLASLAINSLSSARKPEDGASAFIVEFEKRNVLLTVRHAVGDGRNWSVAVQYVQAAGMQLYQLGKMGFVKSITIGDDDMKFRDVDFSYVAVPKSLRCVDEELDPSGRVLRSVAKRLLPPEVVAPDASDQYSFYGFTRNYLDKKSRLHLEPKHETELKFIGFRGDYLRFACKTPYLDFAEYIGCSGAPILNSKGQLVSMVVGGTKARTEILGLDLQRYWGPVLIEAGVWDTPSAPSPESAP